MNAKLTSWEIMMIESLVQKAHDSNREGFSRLCADDPGVCENYGELLQGLLDKLACATELRVSRVLPR